MQPSLAAPKANRSLWIPWMFVLGFAIVIGVNAVLIVTSVSTFSGLETDKAYEQGIKYNTTLSAAAANEQIGWHATSTFTRIGGGHWHIDVLLTDRAMHALPGLRLTAILVRPTSAGLDQRLALTGGSGGHYDADFVPAALGNWELRLLAVGTGTTWQDSKRIFLE